MMHTFELQEHFGLEHLRPQQRLIPELSPTQVLLKMEAISLNFRDLMMVQGDYNPRQALPLIPCSDGVGVVVAVGELVSRVGVGDRVLPIFAQKWCSGRPTQDVFSSTLGGPLDGTLCEYMAVEASGVVRAPEHMSAVEAATLPCAAVTAWSALVTHGSLSASDVVLVQGTGGVSMFALHIARMFGARVIVTSSSDAKLERAKTLGAYATINYRRHPEWGKKARAWAGGEGVDHVVEVGGAGTLAQSLKAVAPGGRISVIGVLSGIKEPLNILPILMRNVTMQGVFVGHRGSFEAMNQAFAEHKVTPWIDSVFGFDEAPLAFEYLGRGVHMGKVCISL